MASFFVSHLTLMASFFVSFFVCLLLLLSSCRRCCCCIYDEDILCRNFELFCVHVPPSVGKYSFLVLFLFFRAMLKVE